MADTNLALGDAKHDLDHLLTMFSTSFYKAARTLRDLQTKEDENRIPEFIYHMPKMELEIELGLTASKQKVKGFFIFKKSKKDETTLTSRLKIDIVAVPRQTTQET